MEAEVRGQFVNLEEGQRPPLEAHQATTVKTRLGPKPVYNHSVM
jgi:hypothetical protein